MGKQMYAPLFSSALVPGCFPGRDTSCECAIRRPSLPRLNFLCPIQVPSGQRAAKRTCSVRLNSFLALVKEPLGVGVTGVIQDVVTMYLGNGGAVRRSKILAVDTPQAYPIPATRPGQNPTSSSKSRPSLLRVVQSELSRKGQNNKLDLLRELGSDAAAKSKNVRPQRRPLISRHDPSVPSTRQ